MTETGRPEACAGVRAAEAANAEATARAAWLCTGRRCWRLPQRLARLLEALSERLGGLLGDRLERQRWIRYRLPLTAPRPPAPAGVALRKIDEAVMQQLQSRRCANHNQLQSAVRFWQHGLRNAYVWLEDGEPLCFLWLLLPEHNARLRTLPGWSGMYPPLPPRWGQFENCYSFGRGLRRRGGAATPFAHAIMDDARAYPLDGLVTHVHENNLMARRWAERIGFRPFGTIRRYRLDLRGMRGVAWHVHRTTAVSLLPPPRQPPHRPAPTEGPR